jgi:hypothetical protein
MLMGVGGGRQPIQDASGVELAGAGVTGQQAGKIGGAS